MLPTDWERTATLMAPERRLDQLLLPARRHQRFLGQQRGKILGADRRRHQQKRHGEAQIRIGPPLALYAILASFAHAKSHTARTIHRHSLARCCRVSGRRVTLLNYRRRRLTAAHRRARARVHGNHAASARAETVRKLRHLCAEQHRMTTIRTMARRNRAIAHPSRPSSRAPPSAGIGHEDRKRQPQPGPKNTAAAETRAPAARGQGWPPQRSRPNHVGDQDAIDQLAPGHVHIFTPCSRNIFESSRMPWHGEFSLPATCSRSRRPRDAPRRGLPSCRRSS